jgi:hypothetical protein
MIEGHCPKCGTLNRHRESSSGTIQRCDGCGIKYKVPYRELKATPTRWSCGGFLLFLLGGCCVLTMVLPERQQQPPPPTLASKPEVQRPVVKNPELPALKPQTPDSTSKSEIQPPALDKSRWWTKQNKPGWLALLRLDEQRKTKLQDILDTDPLFISGYDCDDPARKLHWDVFVNRKLWETKPEDEMGFWFAFYWPDWDFGTKKKPGRIRIRDDQTGEILLEGDGDELPSKLLKRRQQALKKR